MQIWVRWARWLLPKRLRTAARTSAPWRRLHHRHLARNLARTTKRLDICVADLTHVFHLAGSPSVVGKTCLEIGSGWVLTHSLTLHLLGARRVIATDIVPIALPQTLNAAVREAQAGLIPDLLAPFSSYSDVRHRLGRLRQIANYSFASLGQLGVEYRAPIDLSRVSIGEPVDFIFSTSVLEHVPENDVSALLDSLAASLRPGGQMVHCIHLEDHEDLENAPFAFLSLDGLSYSREMQTARGNRLRLSSWLAAFNSTNGLQTELAFQWTRQDQHLPQNIDPSIQYTDANDLSVGAVILVSRKR
jgi:hypothetical protein